MALMTRTFRTWRKPWWRWRAIDQRRERVEASEPAIALSNNFVAEDAAVGATVGTFSFLNGSGTYTFTLTDSAGGLFAIDGDDLEVADALDFDTTGQHSITVEADNGVDDPTSQVFIIRVTDA